MTRSWIWFLVLQLGLAAGSVIELSSKDVTSSVAEGDWLLEFYAPWCGFCKQLEPTYTELAVSLLGKGVKVARIDGSKHKAVGAMWGVNGYPTIFHIHNAEVRKHEGARTIEALESFALEDYKTAKPEFSSLTSPLGLPSRCLVAVLEGTLWLEVLYNKVRTALGMSHAVALGVCMVLTMGFGSFLGFLLSLLFPIKREEKRD